MRKYIAMIMAIAATVAVVACAGKNKETGVSNEVDEPQQKVLVLYYSQTGTTEAIATELKAQLNADVEKIELENEYSGTYEETLARVVQERQTGPMPALKPMKVNIDDYDVIFLGYPIWFGTYALPIRSLMEQYDFAGKTIVPFCSFGSGGLEASAAGLKEALPKATIAEGYGVRTERIGAVKDELNRFLIENGYKPGDIDPLPEFSEQEPVTDDDKAIFDEACGGYEYPLGTPVTVGKRELEHGTEYRFEVPAVTMYGEDVMSIIYVIADEDDDTKPEFIRVVK